METKYIKVLTSERLPEKEGKYTVKRKDADEGYHDMYWYDGVDINKSFWNSYIEYWLEEVPDYTNDLLNTLERCEYRIEKTDIHECLIRDMKELINKLSPR